jgi:hypothetical protein
VIIAGLAPAALIVDFQVKFRETWNTWPTILAGWTEIIGFPLRCCCRSSIPDSFLEIQLMAYSPAPAIL